jgi:hypothetical protein
MAKKVAGAYLAILFTVFIAKMVELNGAFQVLMAAGIVLGALSILVALVVLLEDL